MLTCARILDPAAVFTVKPEDVPNANWLRPGVPCAGQKAFGDALLAAHPFALIPSAVSSRSWNVVFNPGIARGSYGDIAQEPFAIDTRLHPPGA
jgi:RES domain-containing protein